MGNITSAVFAMNKIHQTAIIDEAARLGRNNVIGAYTIIGKDVIIGDDNWIGPHCVFGTPAQFSTKKFELSKELVTGIVIGSRNVIREFTTVHQPSKYKTSIADDCYLMSYCHVSHDTVIKNKVIVANTVQLGGFSFVDVGANIGLSAVTHQFATIGAFAMVGMGSMLTCDAPPFGKVYGNPARLRGVNTEGARRNGFSEEAIATIRDCVRTGALPLDKSLRSYFETYYARNASTGRKSMTWNRSADSARKGTVSCGG